MVYAFQDNVLKQGLPADVKEDRDTRRVESTFHRQKRASKKSNDDDENVVILKENPFVNLNVKNGSNSSNKSANQFLIPGWTNVHTGHPIVHTQVVQPGAIVPVGAGP